MGQQQLLLIVLGVIIVGVAIVAGLGLFNAGAEESIKDEIVSQCLAIGANAQQWYKKPVAMGGGGGAFDGTYNTAGGWVIPDRMLATANCGIINPDGTGAPGPNGGGYVATVGAQQIVLTGQSNEGDYEWHIECTITPLNITTVVTPGRI